MSVGDGRLSACFVGALRSQAHLGQFFQRFCEDGDRKKKNSRPFEPETV